MEKINRREFISLLSSGAVWSLFPLSCSRDDVRNPGEREESRTRRHQIQALGTHPNILWIIWDTVRSDHLGIYGYEKPTTPFLDGWAQGGLVFDNCVSIANCTVPSHVSMFTGLMPSEHRRDNTNNYIVDEFSTLPELLSERGYQTYLFSANPHVSRARNMSQGFDVTEHPWDDKYMKAAYRIMRKKIPLKDKTSNLSESFHSGHMSRWGTKICGELANVGVQQWLSSCDRKRPFFVFINYMEAHAPLFPEESYRRRVMSMDQVNESYRIDRSWIPFWSYTFRLAEYSEKEIEITRLTYDAAVAELDDLLGKLLTSLEVGGYLNDTVVIVTSDHGEHLGEHHIFDHQFSVYEPLIRIPLIIHFKELFPPGRESRPVMNLDLFPTILQLAGIELPEDLSTKAVSLLNPESDRIRMVECPAYPTHWFDAVRKYYPHFDPTPWQRTLRAIYKGEHKYIWASDEQSELYNLKVDPGESENLIHMQADLAADLDSIHNEWIAGFKVSGSIAESGKAISKEELDMLEALGYAKPGTGN